MVTIIPSILTTDPLELRQMLEKCEGVVDRVHIDIIDGKYANNKTIEPSSLERIETSLNIDFHLMVENPIDWVEKCVRSGADRIIAQVEKMNDQLEFFGKVQTAGVGVGFALDLGTPIGIIDESLLTELDVVLVMNVKAGFGGQQFEPQSLDTINKLKEIKSKDSSPFAICADGGINSDNINTVLQAGADEIVMGRTFFENIEKWLTK